MAGWEPITHKNTLLIERCDRAKYKIHPFFRRVTPEGQAYLSPLSMLLFENSQLVFDNIEFVYTPSGQNASQDGDTALTTNDFWQRLSLAE